VLGYEEVSFASSRGLGFIGGFTVQQHYHVRVVLECASVPQIVEHRAFVGALFGPSVQLRNRNDRDPRLFG
jgi:hypothetical protein